MRTSACDQKLLCLQPRLRYARSMCSLFFASRTINGFLLSYLPSLDFMHYFLFFLGKCNKYSSS